MIKHILFPISFVLSISVYAQDIQGEWHSSDGTRTYHITREANESFRAVISNSLRKDDSVGYTIINELKYNSRKKRYEGVMYAPSDGTACMVKVSVDKKDSSRLLLKLDRMFIFDVSLYWSRRNG